MKKDNKWMKRFLTIATGQTISLIGSSAVQFSLIWWMAKKTDSPMMLALAGLMAYLPQIFLGPFAGVWIDRMKRKYVIVGADLFIGLAAGLLSICFFIWDPPVWGICLVLLVRATGTVFHQPAIQAIVPLLVPQDQLMKANGWNQFMQSGAFMLGPVIGAVMYGALPMEIILLTDLAGALIASLTVVVTEIPEIPKKEGQYPNFIREFKEGIQVYRKDPKMLYVLLAAGGSMIWFLPLASFYPLMSSSYFGVSAVYASVVEFLYALGMMVAALAIGSVSSKVNKLHLAWGGLFGFAITTLVSGVLPSSFLFFWVFAAICTFMGACANIYGIPLMAYMQETIEPEMQGRAFSLLGTVMSLAMPIGLAIAGPLAERLGVAPWFFISGVCMLIIVVVLGMISSRSKNK